MAWTNQILTIQMPMVRWSRTLISQRQVARLPAFPENPYPWDSRFFFFLSSPLWSKSNVGHFFLKTPNFLEDKWSPASLRLWAGTFGQPGRFRRRRGLSKPSSHRWRIWGGFGLNFLMFSSSVNRYLQDQAQEGQVAILQRTLHGCINLFSPEEFSISFPSLMKANWVRFTCFALFVF